MKILKEMAAVFLVVASPSLAQEQDSGSPLVKYGSSGEWTIYGGKSDCSMVASYESGNRLIIQFDDRLGSVRLLFSDTATKSLKDGDKRKLEVVFVNPGYDDGWGEKEFTVSVLDDKTFFSSGFDASDLLKDLAKHGTIAFLYKENVVRSLSLTGSAAGILKLRECARKQATLNPSDLFAE